MHPGGPYWAKKDAGAWSVPKGELEPGRGAARRRAPRGPGGDRAHGRGPFLPLGEVRQKAGKRVTAWAARAEFDPAALASATFEMEWPPRSGRRQAFPEVDRAAWFALDEARVRILEGQRPLLDALERALAAGAARRILPRDDAREPPRRALARAPARGESRRRRARSRRADVRRRRPARGPLGAARRARSAALLVRSPTAGGASSASSTGGSSPSAASRWWCRAAAARSDRAATSSRTSASAPTALATVAWLRDAAVVPGPLRHGRARATSASCSGRSRARPAPSSARS